MPHRSVSRSGGPPPPVPPLRGGAQSCSRQPAAGLGLTLGLIAMLSQPLASAAAPATGTGAASAPTRSEASAATPGPVAPYSSAAFQKLLNHGTLEELAEGCQRVYASDQLDRLRKLRERLLLIHPAPQPLPVVLANAEVLLRCRQPNAALTVLDRISPAPGAERVQWLLMEWRAAHAAMDHRRAALALERLGAAGAGQLEALELPLQQRDDGSVVTRHAIDLLAQHLEARGFQEAAAALLLGSRDPGAAGAQRRLEAVRLLRHLPPQEREALLDAALDQAAAAGAWGLVAELLDAQVGLPSERARQRRLRLSPRIDDAYGEWLLLREDPGAAARSAALERLLRSPDAPGGHNATPQPTGSTAPPSPAMPSPSAPGPRPTRLPSPQP